MKRYGARFVSEPYESPTGHLMLAHEVEVEVAKLRAVVEALPRCEHMSCQQGRPVATRIVWWDEGVEYYCDDCDCGRELPYADALRALTGQ